MRSLDGKYITTGNKIDIFDRFSINCTDLAGNNYERFFEVIDIIPTQGKTEGTILTIDCLGIEYHLQHIHTSKPFYFENAFNVIKDMASIYNENKGSSQPLIINHNTVWNGTVGNGAPKFTVNNYEYGIAEDKVYHRMMDVVDKLGASVDNGGALTFYDLSFRAIDHSAVRMRVRASGDNTPTIIIKNAKITNPKTVGEQEGMLSNPTGTNVLSWGSPDHGTLPIDYSKFYSGVEYFYFRPEWVSGVSYPQNAKVRVENTSTRVSKHYYSNINNNTSTPPTNWTQFDMSDSVGEVNGDNVQYSPWTDGKSSLWKNSMANPSNANATNTFYAWDQNLVIWDEGFFRTWVNVCAISDAQLEAFRVDAYTFDNTITSLPRGFRVLVKGVGSGALVGFSNMVVEWTGTAWRRKYKFEGDTSDVLKNSKVQVAVLHEARVYEDTITFSSPNIIHTWNPLTGAEYGNECFHPVSSVTNAKGWDLVNNVARSDVIDSVNRPDITKDGLKFGQNIDSALKFTYHWDAIGTGSQTTPTGNWYKRGGWANFQLPFPCTAYNGITETVGALYKPATIDIQNMHNTPDGSRGYNKGSQTESLGTINGIAFWIKFSNNCPVDIDANDLFRVFMIDTSDNIVFADFNIEFRDHWEDIKVPISSFRAYRGRKPAYGLDQVITLVPPKELDNVNQFEWRNVKFVGIQWQLSYDEFGRYNPASQILKSGNVEMLLNQFSGGDIDLYIDAFRFTKPLLVTSGQDTLRNLEPVFMQRPNISNYWQLRNDAKGQLEIEKFQHKEFNMETSGDAVFDIDFADSFYLYNPKLVSDSDSGSNTIRLVAKRIEYSITKTTEGSGGLRRRINGSKVFT